MEAYPLDDDGQVQMDHLDESIEHKHPYSIQRLQTLLASIAVPNDESDMKDYSPIDHIINTRVAAYRRPGLIRLKRSD
ncbi:unnamed protein product [Rotaria sordida]|uniref:Uncharacterized protein n=1 Tax=Rotaria sordida TaxID=392033 RepID=A0A819R9N0_9BILA|nr:unnamed protein product [Rotaria sordida]CAF0898951.1 unnamed protein product [Rotaria sordida]CAF0912207.1 unnamed protein product [Rotaria sordida]CAF4042468.1 unnamed protein product [Rotaria sordida]